MFLLDFSLATQKKEAKLDGGCLNNLDMEERIVRCGDRHKSPPLQGRDTRQNIIACDEEWQKCQENSNPKVKHL